VERDTTRSDGALIAPDVHVSQTPVAAAVEIRFECSTVASGSGDVTLVVHGDIDHATAPSFAAALAPLVEQGGVLRVDLSRVAFMGSSGVHVLTDAASAIGGRGSVVVCDPSAAVRRVLHLRNAWS
jgi:anti-anti-sigma factor